MPRFEISSILFVVLTALSLPAKSQVLRPDDHYRAMVLKMVSKESKPHYGQIDIKLCSVTNETVNLCEGILTSQRFKFSNKVAAFSQFVKSDIKPAFEINDLANELLAKYPHSDIQLKFLFSLYDSEDALKPLSPISVEYFEFPSLDKVPKNSIQALIYRISLVLHDGKFKTEIIFGIERKRAASPEQDSSKYATELFGQSGR